MIRRLSKWWSKWWADYKEACQERQERWESVRCPYCGLPYGSKKINTCKSPTDVKDLNTIKCEGCKSIFGVRRIVYHDPSYAMWQKSVKIWENK